MKYYNAFISYSHAADGKLAPALQVALHKFAKPIYKRRHLNIFRDEASLAVSPHLWSNITKALEQSEYLIYMASPQSANSKWVIMEIEYWLKHKSLDTLLLALTDGEIAWDDAKNTFHDGDNNALPTVLKNALKAEPFYIDLRTSRTEEDVSLKNPIFKKEVLKLAAHLHGKEPQELASEEVRTHRMWIVSRNIIGTALILLLGLFIYQTIEANKQTKIAKAQTKIAKIQTKIARDSSESAQRQRAIAEVQTQIAKDSSEAAQRQRDMARRQTKIAILERNKAQANFLITKAQTAPNQTLAFLYAKEALKFNSDSSIYTHTYKIYAKNNLFKSIAANQNIGMQDSIAFLEDGYRFITYGVVDNLNEKFGEDTVPSVNYIDKGNRVVTRGEAYRLWDTEGQLLSELSRTEALKYLPNGFKKESETLEAKWEKDNDYHNIVVSEKATDTIIWAIKQNLPREYILDVWVDRNNEILVSQWSDGLVRLWDLKTKVGSTYDTSWGDILPGSINIIFSDNGATMLISGYPGFQIWQRNQGLILHSKTFENSIDEVLSTNDSNILKIKCSDSVFSYDYFQNKVLWKPVGTVSRMPIESNTDDYYVSGDYGTMITRKSKDEKFAVEVVGQDSEIMSFAVFPSKQFIVISQGRNEISVHKNPSLYWENGKQKSIEPVSVIRRPLPLLKEGRMVMYVFSKDEKFLITVGEHFNEESKKESYSIFLWDLEFGGFLKDLTVFFKVESINWENFHIQFSPDNSKLIFSIGNQITVLKRPPSLNEFLDSDSTNDLQAFLKSQELVWLAD